jgi:hypothetical protein
VKVTEWKVVHVRRFYDSDYAVNVTCHCPVLLCFEIVTGFLGAQNELIFAVTYESYRVFSLTVLVGTPIVSQPHNF